MVDIVFYIFAEILVRAAYTAFYLKIVPPELYLKSERNCLLALYGVYATFQFAAAFIYLFQCGPHIVAERHDPTAQCISPAAMHGIFQTIFYFDCIFDWIMVLIPMRVVWNNTTSKRHRIGALSVLSLGCCAGILAITIICLSRRKTHYSQANPAYMQLSMQIDIAATLEVMVAIVCLCLATYKPLFRTWLDAGSRQARLPSQACITMLPDAGAFGIVEMEDNPRAPSQTFDAKFKSAITNIVEFA